MDYEDLLYDLDSGVSLKETTTPLYPKFQGMFWIFAEALLIMVLGLRCIEKGNKASRILALIGLGAGAISILLQLLLVWEVFPYMESTGFFSYSLSAMGKITSFATITMIASIVGALVMRIKENEKTVKILKIVAVVSGFGIWLITTIMIFASDLDGISKIMNLEGVFSACFMTGWITALVVSKMNQKDGKEEIAEKKETLIKKVVEPVKTEPVVQTEPIQVEPEPTPEVEPLPPVQEESGEPQETPPEVNF